MIIRMVSFDEKKLFDSDRAEMVRHQLMARDITDSAVLEVMGRIPREEFVPEKYRRQAYTDQPLPIGTGQTISQPYIVALMTQCLKLDKDCAILEIGTGSGYQTAILAKLAKKVYTIERHNQLSEFAQTALARIGVENVEFFIGDGTCGWPDPLTFDRIMITAAVAKIPQPLLEQLCDTGLTVAPIGGELFQELIVYEKKQDQLISKNICGCRFVKLIGKHGYPES